MVVQRHALDEHAPGLAGPCQVACAEGDVTSFLEWAAEGDRAAALCRAAVARSLLCMPLACIGTHSAIMQKDRASFCFSMWMPVCAPGFHPCGSQHQEQVLRPFGVLRNGHCATAALPSQGMPAPRTMCTIWYMHVNSSFPTSIHRSSPRRFGGALTVLVAASDGGLLGAHVLADDVAPCWSESPPLCVTDDRRLLAVRSEVRRLSKHTLVDVGMSWKCSCLEACSSSNRHVCSSQRLPASSLATCMLFLLSQCLAGGRWLALALMW